MVGVLFVEQHVLFHSRVYAACEWDIVFFASDSIALQLRAKDHFPRTRSYEVAFLASGTLAQHALAQPLRQGW